MDLRIEYGDFLLIGKSKEENAKFSGYELFASVDRDDGLSFAFDVNTRTFEISKRFMINDLVKFHDELGDFIGHLKALSEPKTLKDEL